MFNNNETLLKIIVTQNQIMLGVLMSGLRDKMTNEELNKYKEAYDIVNDNAKKAFGIKEK